MEKIYFVLSLLYLCICKSGGFSIIEITSLSKTVTERCNRTWQFTDHIDLIKVPDKNSEPNDNCYCMIYHPVNQALLYKLIILVDNFDPGNVFTKWHQIYINGWKTDHYKVPVFKIASSGSVNNRNLFYTYVLYGESQQSTTVPVRITFEQIGGNFTQPLHLSCSPDGYALPDVLKRKPTTATVEPTVTAAFSTPENAQEPSPNTNLTFATSNTPCEQFTPSTSLTICNCSNESRTTLGFNDNKGGLSTVAVAVITCLLGIIIGVVVTSLIFMFYIKRKMLQIKEENSAYLRLSESRTNIDRTVIDNNNSNSIAREENPGNDNLGYTTLHIDGAGYSIADFPDEPVRESVTDSVQYEQVNAYLDPVSIKQNIENVSEDISVTNPGYIEPDYEATA